MIVTFCGHADTILSKKEKERLEKIVRYLIDKNPGCKFYLGGYGSFDMKCLEILTDIKKQSNKIERIFITPYLNESYFKLQQAKYIYDDTIYPPIENSPLDLQ